MNRNRIPSNKNDDAVVPSIDENRRQNQDEPSTSGTNQARHNQRSPIDIFLLFAEPGTDLYQRWAWNEMKMALYRHINRVRLWNIDAVVQDLLKINLVRGRGLFCTTIIKTQRNNPQLTYVYAATVALINEKLPDIGKLLLNRLNYEFLYGIRQRIRNVAISTARLIAHLTNQGVIHKFFVLEILTFLIRNPCIFTVEVAVAIVLDCGVKLEIVARTGLNAFFANLEIIRKHDYLDKRIKDRIGMALGRHRAGFAFGMEDEAVVVQAANQRPIFMMLDDDVDTKVLLGMLGSIDMSIDGGHVLTFSNIYFLFRFIQIRSELSSARGRLPKTY